ncbi:uncharacterized protein BDZ99DRAFT_464102 [Mytilinidion resinicola]|uniref:Uncharacterized protein n=1 Tax=Mytilinidion resinicola TaxID=574789 RepID=A0A6A6YJV9_9PEZI|nr:uncharacterized protein BDZ99DRAFT_464102 [Mytilinidion resinicola]KAF2808207.1 hypothetical protein BDZ99DRAFT_464102 [Mytilinidion resinicola]
MRHRVQKHAKMRHLAQEKPKKRGRVKKQPRDKAIVFEKEYEMQNRAQERDDMRSRVKQELRDTAMDLEEKFEMRDPAQGATELRGLVEQEPRDTAKSSTAPNPRIQQLREMRRELVKKIGRSYWERQCAETAEARGQISSVERERIVDAAMEKAKEWLSEIHATRAEWNALKAEKKVIGSRRML